MKSLEQRLLAPSDALLLEAASDVLPRADVTEARLVVLEAVAARFAGWNLEDFWRLVGRDAPTVSADPMPWADKMLTSITETGISTALALSALSREILPDAKQRRMGAYYTDWRLAESLAAAAVRSVTTEGPWVDTACGSGVLLAAAAMQVPAGSERDALIRERLLGADLSANALRGTLLSVASLTSDLSAVQAFSNRLLCQDSLTSGSDWSRTVPDGAALVIGNPPWEKLRISRHEKAKSAGAKRDYGQSFESNMDLSLDRSRLVNYVEQVASGTHLQGRGEHDLYKLFLELGLGLTASSGVLALLLPAGLIRSQGTEVLRRELLEMSRELSIAVIENRARHFAIDTRFKFLTVMAKVDAGRKRPIALRVADRNGSLPEREVNIGRSALAEVRPDLSIPEVHSPDEWDLYRRLASRGVEIGDPLGPWKPKYRREIDMTLDRKLFRREAIADSVPLLEGRHVSQFRWRSKRYMSGEGRSASWIPEQMNKAQLNAQWHLSLDDLRPATVISATRSRIGFCDITGQTNERSLLAARIPSGVVCGNKVPTIEFDNGGDDREDLFLALVNSLVVDWMLRRVVTTTVNFFLLDSLHLPPIDVESGVGQELVWLARKISASEGDHRVDLWQVGEWRARSDALVAASWGLDTRDVALLLRDFPLLDRGQPAIEGEGASTVTADCILAELAELMRRKHPSIERVKQAHAAGAIPYIPAEHAMKGLR